MRKAQSRQILVLQRKQLEVLNNLGQLGEDEIQGLLLEDQVGVIGNCRRVNINPWFDARSKTYHSSW